MRKLLIMTLCIVTLLTAGLVPAAAREAFTFSYAEVATEKGTLNMRNKPQDGAKVVDTLPRGGIVNVLEELDGWTHVQYGGEEGYVKTSFLRFIDELPYPLLTSEDKGDAVMAVKRSLYHLGYLKTEDITQRYDDTLKTALTKLQLMNGLPVDPQTITPELQALLEWGMICEAKTGYLDTATDSETDLSVSIFCWDSAGMLYEKDQAVKLEISYAVQASGGRPPYDITVKKSLGGEGSGDEVGTPFSFIWGQETDRLYIYACVTDADGNTVTACAPFKYALPARYRGVG